MEFFYKKILKTFNINPELPVIDSDKIKKKEINTIEMTFDLNGFYYNDSHCKSITVGSGQVYLQTLNHDLIVTQNYDFVYNVISKMFNFFKSKKIYILDFYFKPVGWLLNKNRPDVLTNNFKIIFMCNDHTELIAQLQSKIKLLNVKFELVRNRLSCAFVNAVAETALLTYWPFNTNYCILTIFLAKYIKSNKEKEFLTKEIIMPFSTSLDFYCKRIRNIYILEDHINLYKIKKIETQDIIKDKFYIQNIGTGYEIFNGDISSSFSNYENLFPSATMNYSLPYIKKRFVSILDLPDDTEIFCLKYDHIVYIYKIGNDNLNPILILKLDQTFLKKIPFKGSFVKKNIVHKKRITVKITSDDFVIDDFNPRSTRQEVTRDAGFEGSKIYIVSPTFYF